MPRVQSKRARRNLPIFWNLPPKNITDQQKRVAFQKSQKVLNHSTLLCMFINYSLIIQTVESGTIKLLKIFQCSVIEKNVSHLKDSNLNHPLYCTYLSLICPLRHHYCTLEIIVIKPNKKKTNGHSEVKI